MMLLLGHDALSEFRLRRINNALLAVADGCRVLRARWVYLVETTGDAAVDPMRLAGILQADAQALGDPAGDSRLGEHPDAAFAWVVPRLGTRSPWSSKTTDLLRACGLPIERIERGQLLTLDGAVPVEASAASRLLHDPMTQSLLTDFRLLARVFESGIPAALVTVPLGSEPLASLGEANVRLALALSQEEVGYLADRYGALRRDPTDAELMMFAQANSEHCRHKVFNAAWAIDGEVQPMSLFAMIKNTHAVTPAHTLSAYHDNAAVIEGSPAQHISADPLTRAYRVTDTQLDFAIKVETHNHPTAIAPFPGAATGAGGEIRDEAATGRGGKPKAGLTGFTTSHLRIPGLAQPWETARALSPRLASAFEIMRDGPLGAAAFNNEFGRPAICGYFRSFEQCASDHLTRGYDKPIMLAGGIGNIRREHVAKLGLRVGDAIVVLGGPAMLIGLGGGAASSLAGGSTASDIDFASVQRDNPEMQRRCQEVIDRCMGLGTANPIASIHDVGAGGLSNAIPEILHDSSLGGRIELRAIASDDPALSPMQLWCNEAQERYVLGMAPSDIARFAALCERERCPFAVVGHATGDGMLEITDALLGRSAVAMPMDLLFGSTPRMHRQASRPASVERARGNELRAADLNTVLMRVLRHPSVAHKGFLITIGDRTVGGLVARDPLVGPWQVPVADHALTLLDFDGYAGEAMAIGERTPVALDDAPAAARLAVAEAITNLLGAPIDSLSEIKLSANWMAAIAHPGEDLRLFDAVRAVGLELCPALGLSIPVGKDSLSMATRFAAADGVDAHCVSPMSLVVSAFARIGDVREAVTPVLRLDCGATSLVWVDLGAGQRRLGRSIASEVTQIDGGACADLDRPENLRGLFAAVRELKLRRRVLALHDVSDGGVAIAAVEMAFAARAGLDMRLSEAQRRDPIGTLFAEEPGVLLQVRDEHLIELRRTLDASGLAGLHAVFAQVHATDRIRIGVDANPVDFDRTQLFAAWQETSHAMQHLRDDPGCAAEERASVLDDTDPGLNTVLTFDRSDDIAAPFIARGAKPRIAILREQGVNGQVEMAAAFMRAGFDAHDVHMSDLASGRQTLTGFVGLAACGGFSWGDVLGAGRGWATAITQQPRVAAQFGAFFADPRTFALGVCNGCQMFAALGDLVPGATHWPRFLRNRSEQFEARLSLIEVLDSRSILLRGMAGSRLPVAVAHGEGRAEFASAEGAALAQTCLRYIDNHGGVAERYPANPNGSELGATGFCNDDGRVTILMPHPERVFRAVQLSWQPLDWAGDSPWMRMFRNARAWVA